MIIQCANPGCYSENVTRQSADSNDFICDDCGHQFREEDEDDVELDNSKLMGKEKEEERD